MKTPVKKKKEIMTVSYTPPNTEIKIGVADILYSIMKKYSVKHIIAQLQVNAYLEGLARCNTLSAMLIDKKDVNKVAENAEAALALLYLRHNWKHCVEEGKKTLEELNKNRR